MSLWFFIKVDFSAGRGIENLVLSAHNLENAVLVLMGWGRIEEHLKSLIANERLEDRVLPYSLLYHKKFS